MDKLFLAWLCPLCKSWHAHTNTCLERDGVFLSSLMEANNPYILCTMQEEYVIDAFKEKYPTADVIDVENDPMQKLLTTVIHVVSF